MRRAVHLHPAVVMLALLAGGTLGGFFGLLLAVPTTAVLKIIFGHVWRTWVLGEPLDEIARQWAVEDLQPAVGFVERVGAKAREGSDSSGADGSEGAAADEGTDAT
jgi:hypothetical protein